MKLLARSVVTAFVALAVAVGSVTLAPTVTQAAATRCGERWIDVNVGVPAVIAGTLCVPRGADTVQILVPGSTYNRVYWQFPGRSYTKIANAAGYATFAMDRLDTGKSTQILPELDTATADSVSIHQVIKALGFKHTILVGHSLGSLVTVQYAAKYRDVDGIVLTGMTTYLSLEFVQAMATGALIPTRLDPNPDLQARLPGELTMPNVYRTRYFHSPDVPRSVVRYDNTHKDAFSAAELPDGLTPDYLAGLPVQLVSVPVLMVEGDHDKIFECADGHPCRSAQEVRQQDGRKFVRAPRFDAYVSAGAAHDLAESQQYRASGGAIQRWVMNVVTG